MLNGSCRLPINITGTTGHKTSGTMSKKEITTQLQVRFFEVFLDKSVVCVSDYPLKKRDF